MFAAEEESIEVVRALIDAGADVDMWNATGRTALVIAAERGSVHAEELVRLLVARGATLPHNEKVRPKNAHKSIKFGCKNGNPTPIRSVS